VNLVAAIPSLHAGMTAAIAAFLWHRVHRGWRPVLVAYVLIMAFTLVYTAEHYVIDILLGWAFAAAAVFALNRYDKRRRARASTRGEIDLAQGLGDRPDRVTARSEVDDVAAVQVERRAVVGELDPR
jgi:membrane-associated phospholipid phosphatase